jgi:hypothetical protein
VLSDEQIYIFDVSQATLECEEGMITGDNISVIYEGQLSDTDTSSVKALKVVDEFHKKNKLETRTAHGQVQSMTPNTITILSKSGKTATYPITGTEQYYQNGIKVNDWVYLHFKGKFLSSDSDDTMVLNASHLKVLSVSDIDPIDIPEPTPTPELAEEQNAQNTEKKLRAVIQDVSLNLLQILPEGSETSVNVDLSAIPSYFKGGTAPGSYVTLIYTGEFNGSTLDGITILSVTGDDPDTLAESRITSTISGTIIGFTSNTITIRTTDNAIATCQMKDGTSFSADMIYEGNEVKVTFNPSLSKTSNIYTCISIESI